MQSETPNDFITFEHMLMSIADRADKGWVYLPNDRRWSLGSKSVILESDEVPPELEDEPDAGVPEFAKQHDLMQVLCVSVVQDIVANARAQKPRATASDLFRAFEFYFKHDAFMEIS